MDNPFKQFLPAEEPTPESVEEQVMESVRLKSHFANIFEFFLSIFGGFVDPASSTHTSQRSETGSDQP